MKLRLLRGLGPLKFRGCILAATACLLIAPAATAEVSLGEVKGWEAFTTGRVNAYMAWITGDGSPVDAMGQANTIAGGGLPTGPNTIPEEDAMGMPIVGRPGTISKFRLLSGYVPNVLGIGVRNKVMQDLNLTAFTALWGTIETRGQRKYELIQADFHEAYLDLSGSWGSVRAGKTLSLFSRGSYELHYDYGYRYGVGSQFSVDPSPGNSSGLIGFGVPAATYSAGAYYSTPSLGGLGISLGIFDATHYDSGWNRSNTPRPEGELTFDMESPGFKVHVFANGGFQKLYKNNNAKDSATLWGFSGGAGLEFGPIHVGGNYFMGKGVGLNYAFAQAGGHVATLVGPVADPALMPGVKSEELRKFDGFAALAQYAGGVFDINVAFGQSRAHQLELDKAATALSLIKTQTAIGAGFVFHVSENIHPGVDYMRGMYRWYAGPTGTPKQDVNFINLGATIDW